jgi:integrase
MNIKPLKIPKSKKITGFRVHCGGCRSVVSDTCKLTCKSIDSCPKCDKHKFQQVVHVPGTKNDRRMILIDTRDINVALSQAMAFRKEELEKYQNQMPAKSHDSLLLPGYIDWYKEWLKKSDSITLMNRNRTADHRENILKGFKNAELVWRRSGIEFNKMTIADVNSDRVRELFHYYHTELNYKPRTINKYLGYFKTFINRVNDEHDLDFRNSFEKYKQLPVNSEPSAISIDTYRRLIEAIESPEFKKSGKVGDDWRFYYRDYLVPAIKLGLHTGRRREELVNLRFSDELTEEGARFFRVEDYKVNRIQNRTSEQNKKYILIPVTKGLQSVLDEIGYKHYKGTDNYVLAPELNRERNRRMSDIISRGFAHYYRQIEPEGKLGFGSLRKRYISELVKFFGAEAKGVSQHSSDSVIEHHYLDKKVLMKAAAEFNPEGQDSERQAELKNIRQAGEQTKEQSIEK